MKVEADKTMALLKGVSCPDTAQRRERLLMLEQEIMKLEQVDIPVEQWCHGDIYARKIVIPAGAIMTGRIHKFDHFDVMLSGNIFVSTDDGEPQQFKGFNLFKGKAGKKRAGFAQEETHWITFHSAPEMPFDKMLDYITCLSFEEYEDFQAEVQRLQQKGIDI